MNIHIIDRKIMWWEQEGGCPFITDEEGTRFWLPCSYSPPSLRVGSIVKCKGSSMAGTDVIAQVKDIVSKKKSDIWCYEIWVDVIYTVPKGGCPVVQPNVFRVTRDQVEGIQYRPTVSSNGGSVRLPLVQENIIPGCKPGDIVIAERCGPHTNDIVIVVSYIERGSMSSLSYYERILGHLVYEARSPQQDFPEAKITVNDTLLSQGQSMAARVAVCDFICSLENEGLGEDKMGKHLTKGYLDRLYEVRKLLLKNME